jgi:Family of unknown function (DUF6152)
MRTNSYYIVAVGILLMLTVMPVRAHHAFSSEFDADKPVTLVGPVTKLEWVNPHTWIHVDVTGPDGKVETWMIEAGSPNVLLRRGFNKSMLQIGTVIHISGFQAKGGTNKANGGEMTLPDGRKLLISSTGTGAPGDKDDEKKK